MRRASSTLQAMGFTEIEALVYCYLLTDSTATGYRVSRHIGKPVANTYKAIASLQDRGVLAIADGDNKIFRPVSPDELLSRMDASFHRQREQAAEELSKLSRDHDEEHVYRLSTVEQVISRAVATLARAESIALIEAFPAFWTELKPAIADAVKRKVAVIGKVYTPDVLAGMQTILPRDAQHVLATWPGQQLNLVVDAREYMLVLASHDLSKIHQAVWSNSLFISCMQYNSLWCEFVLTLFTNQGEATPEAQKHRMTIPTNFFSNPGATVDYMKRHLPQQHGDSRRRSAKHSITRIKLPGFAELTRRYAQVGGGEVLTAKSRGSKRPSPREKQKSFRRKPK